MPFVAYKMRNGWKLHWEAIANPISLLLGYIATEILYAKFGFTCIIGLGI